MESRFRDLATRLSASARLLAFAAFPHFCCRCGIEGASLCDGCATETKTPFEGIFVCPGCGAKAPLGGRCGARRCREGALDGLVSAAPYADPVLRELLRLYKYERVTDAGAPLLALFGGFARRHRAVFRALGDAVAVPVPMHRFREALRGFNQAIPLAREFGAGADLPVEIGLLGRGFRMASQAALADDDERRRNARGSVYVLRPPEPGRAYVLVDDVCTTGSTLQECARALKDAGAGAVWAATLLKGSTLHKSPASR